MKRPALAAALTAMLLGAAVAQQHGIGQDAKIAANDPQPAAAPVTIAMGPISAPQKRNPNAAAGSVSESPPASDSTPNKKTKHRHRHPSSN